MDSLFPSKIETLKMLDFRRLKTWILREKPATREAYREVRSELQAFLTLSGRLSWDTMAHLRTLEGHDAEIVRRHIELQELAQEMKQFLEGQHSGRKLVIGVEDLRDIAVGVCERLHLPYEVTGDAAEARIAVDSITNAMRYAIQSSIKRSEISSLSIHGHATSNRAILRLSPFSNIFAGTPDLPTIRARSIISALSGSIEYTWGELVIDVPAGQSNGEQPKLE